MFLGLDLGATTAHFATTSDGKRYKHGTVDVKNFSTFLDQASTIEAVGMEYTGGLALQWARAAMDKGLPVFYIHANERVAYMKMARQRDKTDRKDSVTIARFMYQWGTPALREALGLSAHLFTDARQVQKAWVLRSLLNAANVCKRQKVSHHLRAIAARRCGSEDVALFWEAKRDHYAEEVAELFAKAEEFATTHYPAELDALLTIPGFGPVLSITLLATTMPVERFPDSDKLTAYVGLDPMTKQTGTTLNITRTSNAGNHHTRGLLYMTAMGQIRRRNEFRDHYDSLIARGKKPKVAIPAVARKMLRVAYALMKSKKPYIVPTSPPDPQAELPFVEAAFRPRNVLPPAPVPDFAITQAEYAKRIGISRQAINQKLKAGQLPTIILNDRAYIDTRRAPAK